MHWPLIAFLAFVSLPSFAAPVSYAKDVHVDQEKREITITQAAHDHIADEGLLAVLNQAASKPVFEDGNLVGFSLFEIDADSVFDLAGIIDGDLVTHIDDEALTDPSYAVELLRYVKTQPSFSYTIRHCVDNCRHYWTTKDQKYGAPQRFRVRVTG